MPVARATHMWPHSCRATEMRMASANSTMPRTNIMRLLGPFSRQSGNLLGDRSCNSSPRALACPALRVQYLIHGSRCFAELGGPLVGGVQHIGDRCDDRGEADPACEEGRRRLLVGRVVDGGHAAAGLPRVPRELDRGENVGV